VFFAGDFSKKSVQSTLIRCRVDRNGALPLSADLKTTVYIVTPSFVSRKSSYHFASVIFHAVVAHYFRSVLEKSSVRIRHRSYNVVCFVRRRRLDVGSSRRSVSYVAVQLLVPDSDLRQFDETRRRRQQTTRCVIMSAVWF